MVVVWNPEIHEPVFDVPFVLNRCLELLNNLLGTSHRNSVAVFVVVLILILLLVHLLSVKQKPHNILSALQISPARQLSAHSVIPSLFVPLRVRFCGAAVDPFSSPQRFIGWQNWIRRWSLAGILNTWESSNIRIKWIRLTVINRQQRGWSDDKCGWFHCLPSKDSSTRHPFNCLPQRHFPTCSTDTMANLFSPTLTWLNSTITLCLWFLSPHRCVSDQRQISGAMFTHFHHDSARFLTPGITLRHAATQHNLNIP